ncbi:MAG: chemotaxis response regulator protein-glutamate methylesterase [Firmicutes bacterium]|nr:chemotaxis response regulator protein-glutamate methylesterase [Bacillota bacterium]
MAPKVRVLVVDDSAFMRRVVSDILQSDNRLEVISTARDGLDAIEKIKGLKPDVVTLDIEMPRLNGIEALERIMAECPTRVVMVSSLTQRHARETIRALSLGAVDFVPKPSSGLFPDMSSLKDELVSKVWASARARLRPVYRPPETRPVRKIAPEKTQAARAVVVVGSSTGGPSALQDVMKSLPAGLPAGVLVVQHMPAGFTRSLAERLNHLSHLEVVEASGGEQIVEGRAIMAPGGFHMTFDRDLQVSLTTDPPRHGVRPAVDVTMEAAAAVFGPNCVGVVLTGMGFDGSKGCSAIKSRAGTVIAEHESTCVVYGMPRAVIEMGYADRVCPIGEIADAIKEAVDGLCTRRCSA